MFVIIIIFIVCFGGVWFCVSCVIVVIIIFFSWFFCFCIGGFGIFLCFVIV